LATASRKALICMVVNGTFFVDKKYGVH